MFLGWCEVHLPFSEKSARNYIRLAENWEELRIAFRSSEEPTSIREALRIIDASKPKPEKPKPAPEVEPEVAEDEKVIEGEVVNRDAVATRVEDRGDWEVTTTEKPECVIPEGTVRAIQQTCPITGEVLWDSRWESEDDTCPVPWVVEDIEPPQEKDAAQKWVDDVAGKLIDAGAATPEDIRTFCHLGDYDTIWHAANATTAGTARGIIETAKRTMLANQAFLSIDVFNGGARSIARVPELESKCIKVVLEFIAKHHNGVFQTWMDEKMTEHREKTPKRRGTKN